MKKLFFAMLLTIAFSACEKCYTCELTASGTTQSAEVCDEDQKSSVEAAGFTCTEN